MAGSLVLVNDVLVGDAINHAGRFLQNVGCSCLIASGDGGAYMLDRRAKHGAEAGVVLVARNRLACTFAGLGGVGHSVCISVDSAKTAILALSP